MPKMYDVVIIGSGPSGSAAAYYLASQGINVLLLDKAEFPRDKTCGDGLTPRAISVIQDMGILEQVTSAGYRINGLELHGRLGNSMVSAIPQHPLYPDYLLVVPRFKLDDILCKRAIEAGAEFQGQVRVRDIEQFDDHVVVHGQREGNPIQYQGRVAVLAVGANIKLLIELGILRRSPGVILAARGYYHGLPPLETRVQAHFEHVPLPGYGWVFPTSETSANIGIGFWPSYYHWYKRPASAIAAMQNWLQENVKLKKILGDGKLQGSIKGYPLRIDFTNAPTRSGRILLTGEAAGLVSPFTGEGIDFGLESGQLTARYIKDCFDKNDLSLHALQGYDSMLRQHFQRLFTLLQTIRRLYINPVLMNRAILATNKFPDLKLLLVKIMLSQTDAAAVVNLNTLRKVILLR
jgi:geranylgeranyl reductase family protein